MAQVFTYAQAVESLKDWTAALSAASSGSSYSIGGRTLTRQDVTTIRAEIQKWHNTVLSMEASQRGEKRAMGSQSSFPTPGRGSGGIISDANWEDWRT